MKIGLDIHGVIDKYPRIFEHLAMRWTVEGHEVYIITGQEWKQCEQTVLDCGIEYYTHFSIVDHHKEIGTKMWHDDSRGRGWWMDRDIWIRSKGEFATKIGLDVHFDDQLAYAEFFPDTCTFVSVPPENFSMDWMGFLE